MSHVYGDSTSFPYDVDYIELSRHAVDCAVQLFSAQHAIATTLERAEGHAQARSAELARISAMSRAVETALQPFAGSDVGQSERILQRMLECVQSTVSSELAAVENRAAEQTAQTNHIISRSGESAQRALEGFLIRHDLPGTELGLEWSSSGEQNYSAQVSIRTPFGINSALSLAIPPDHVWARSRRLAELAPGLEVNFPQPAGWLSKRMQVAPVKLDRLFLCAVKLGAASAEFRLRKGQSSGSGYRVLVNLDEDHQVVMQPFGEDGTPDTETPSRLDGEDSAQMFRLCSRVVESTLGLAHLRRSMLSAELDGEPLHEMEWPRTVAERLIEQLAPVVSEIARRSGAPGELVLRRDVGGGRREEVYVTTAELYEKVLVLPPSWRVSFEKLGLHDPLCVLPPAPRSGRAVSPSAPHHASVTATEPLPVAPQ